MKGIDHVNKKRLAGAGAVAVVAATALVLGSTAAVAGESDGVDSAYGIAASGLIPIEPTPVVVSRDGQFVQDSVAGSSSIPGATDAGFVADLLSVEAEAGRAESSVARLRLAEMLRADLVRTYCEDGEGGLELVNASMLGTPMRSPSVAGERIDASPLARVTLGEETRNDDGSLTVTGIKIQLLPGAATRPTERLDADDRAALPVLGRLLGGAALPTDLETVGDIVDRVGLPIGRDGALQTVIIGSATCTERGDDDYYDDDEYYDDDQDEDWDENDEDEEEPEAPAPVVVDEVTVPVTH